jgi:N-methylhydantoinase A
VVLVNARLAVLGVLPTLPAEPELSPATASPARFRRIFVGRWAEVPVYDLETAGSGTELTGPAVFESATTTVVVREHERVTVTPHGWLDIRL